MLIYWGCSPTVQKGQPEIIDFRAMTGKVPPEIQAMADHVTGAVPGAGVIEVLDLLYT